MRLACLEARNCLAYFVGLRPSRGVIPTSNLLGFIHGWAIGVGLRYRLDGRYDERRKEFSAVQTTI